MLQFDIEGRRVLDLFAGSGQMALEAISRGAEAAIMVDKSKEANAIIRKNIEKTKFSEQCRVFCMDFSEYVRRYSGERFDIIFLDPPYSAKLYAPALRALLKGEMLKPTTLIICESDLDDIFEGDVELSERFNEVRVSRYSRTVITILSPKS